MRILQLCCFSNLWHPDHQVESHDLKTGSDVRLLPRDYGKNFDLVCAAPPCDQFTKANSSRWEVSPRSYIEIAQVCFDICRSSAGLWWLENPPGRIEVFLPGLTQFRVLTWSGILTNKEYVIYSNFLILNQYVSRYGKANIARSKVEREAWQPDLIATISNAISLCQSK
jgi:site-specific DNA-cytosine methylase